MAKRVDLQGVFVKISDATKVKGSRTGIPREEDRSRIIRPSLIAPQHSKQALGELSYP